MKKLLFLVLIISNIIFAGNIEDIKTLSFEVLEKNIMSSEEIKYQIDISIPSKFKKTVIAPPLNKGEEYVYSHGKMTVYLPFFDQIQSKNMAEEENAIISTFNKAIEKYKNNKNFKAKYDKKEKLEIELKNNTAKIKSYDIFDGYLLPNEIEIFNKNQKIAKLSISNIKVNPKFDLNYFNITRNKK